jgi:hypothetical protein
MTVTLLVDHDLDGDRIVLKRVGRADELRRSLARVVAALVEPDTRRAQLLSDSIYFLLRCRSVRDMQRELERHNVAWRPESGAELDKWNDVEDDGDADLMGALGRAVLGPAGQGTVNTHESPPADARQPEPRPVQSREPRPPLPALELVRPREAAQLGPPSTSRGAGSGPSSSSIFVPRNVESATEDSELGRRGEEIALALERERVAGLGFSPDLVVWISEATPGADHDIKSVDIDGEPIWVEVKATTGRDGRFHWPSAEFRLAVRLRGRYVLYRIYEANSTAPTWRRLADPIASFEAGELRLDLDRLIGDVGAVVELAAEDSPPSE